MPDLNQRNRTWRYLVQNTLWWIEYAGLAGIREDTFGYADADFLSAWARAVMDEYPDFAMVGEEWSDSSRRRPLAARQGQRQRPRAAHDQHDGLPLHRAARSLAAPDTWESGWMPVYEALANDFLYPDPDAGGVRGEPTPRACCHVDGDLGLWKLAIAVRRHARGIPQFYGSEVLLRGPAERHDGQLRADMPGGWAGDAANAFTGEGLDARQREAREFVRRLFNWRKGATAVHAGSLVHYAPEDGVYVYFREHEGRKVMVALNRNPADAPLALGRFAGSIGDARTGTDVLTGRRMPLGEVLRLPARAPLILELD